MSYDTPPPMPTTPPSPPKRNRTNAIIIGSAVAIIAAIITTGVVVVQATGDDSKPPTAAASSTPPEVEPTTEEPEPLPVYAEAEADDFSIELRTTERQCFGSAGCNVVVEPKLSYLGIKELDPDVVYEITYEITGDDDGPVIETAELSDQSTLNFSRTVVSTPSKSTKLTVEITDVVARDY